jgi:hypothetical protein
MPATEPRQRLSRERVLRAAVRLADERGIDPGSTLGWCDDQTEFEFGLDLILDGLDRLR